MLEEMKYEIKIYWDFANKIYNSEVPELDGCYASGESYEEALQNIIKAMKKWSTRAFASNVIAPQPLGRLPLSDELYCVNCRRTGYSTGKWKRSKE